MVRTQIQLPDELYSRLKQLAEAREWTLAETLRRGAEQVLLMYSATSAGPRWEPPEPKDLGKFQTGPEEWREIANMAGFRR